MPHWMALDTQSEREFTQVGIVQRVGSYHDVKDVNVYVSSDGENWGSPVGSFTVEFIEGEQIFDVTPTRGRYLKLEFVTSYRSTNMCMAEVYVYGED